MSKLADGFYFKSPVKSVKTDIFHLKNFRMYTRVLRKVLGLTQSWRKYDQMIMIFVKYDSLDGVI